MSTSIRHILSMHEDFANENPCLVKLVEEQLGAFICITPKCHPELAGRGIEYAWGYSKLRYRRDINDTVSAHLEENVYKALSSEVYQNTEICLEGSRLQTYLFVFFWKPHRNMSLRLASSGLITSRRWSKPIVRQLVLTTASLHTHE